jgi:LPPG:FO 2-phospho-L-lactate transferase
MITALAGGIGASKFLEGLCAAIDPQHLTIIVNTGDDIKLFGLHISPDLDTVTYTLGGLVNRATGWGIASDTFQCLDAMRAYDGPQWFNLGDRDLATHLFRTEQLRQGHPLSDVADQIRQAHGVGARILPMTESYVPTTILTELGDLHLQEYLVKHRAQPSVKGVRFENIEFAAPARGVAEAILDASGVIVCPSNPLISIGPILAVPGIRELLAETKAPVVAISPIVGGASLKGPTDRMLADLGKEVSALQVARLYKGFVNVFILDRQDVAEKSGIEDLGMTVVVTNTIMSGAAEKLALAQAALEACGTF